MDHFKSTDGSFEFPDNLFPPIIGLPHVPETVTSRKLAILDAAPLPGTVSELLSTDTRPTLAQIESALDWARNVLKFYDTWSTLPKPVLSMAIKLLQFYRHKFGKDKLKHTRKIAGLCAYSLATSSLIDNREKYDLLKQAAKLGVHRAWYHAALIASIKADPESKKKALSRYHKGANWGDSSCLYALALANLYGLMDIEQNVAEGLRLLEEGVKGCDQDSPFAPFVLGKILLDEGGADSIDGLHIPNFERFDKSTFYDSVRGLELMQLSANLGYTPALIRMGYAYNYGEVPFDCTRALRYLSLVSAQEAYCLYRGLTPDTQGAGCVQVAKWFLCGYEDTVPKNVEWSCYFSHVGVQLGNSTALFALGYFYETGTYVKKDLQRAANMYTQSAMDGCEAAEKRLEQTELGQYATGSLDIKEQYTKQEGNSNLPYPNLSPVSRTQSTYFQATQKPIYAQEALRSVPFLPYPDADLKDIEGNTSVSSFDRLSIQDNDSSSRDESSGPKPKRDLPYPSGSSPNAFTSNESTRALPYPVSPSKQSETFDAMSPYASKDVSLEPIEPPSGPYTGSNGSVSSLGSIASADAYNSNQNSTIVGPYTGVKSTPNTPATTFSNNSDTAYDSIKSVTDGSQAPTGPYVGSTSSINIVPSGLFTMNGVNCASVDDTSLPPPVGPMSGSTNAPLGSSVGSASLSNQTDSDGEKVQQRPPYPDDSESNDEADNEGTTLDSDIQTANVDSNNSSLSATSLHEENDSENITLQKRNDSNPQFGKFAELNYKPAPSSAPAPSTSSLHSKSLKSGEFPDLQPDTPSPKDFMNRNYKLDLSGSHSPSKSLASSSSEASSISIRRSFKGRSRYQSSDSTGDIISLGKSRSSSPLRKIFSTSTAQERSDRSRAERRSFTQQALADLANAPKVHIQPINEERKPGVAYTFEEMGVQTYPSGKNDKCIIC